MTTADIINMVSDFQRKNLWGSLELQFRAGQITFVKHTRTYQTAPYEKNSPAPRETDGANYSEPARI